MTPSPYDKIFRAFFLTQNFPFDWKFLKIGSVSVRDITKNVALAPPTPPTIRGVLLHTEQIVLSYLSYSSIKIHIKPIFITYKVNFLKSEGSRNSLQRK